MLTISDISMLFQQCNIAFLSKNTECGQLFSILSNFSKVGLWWYFSFRKSEETPAGSQWGETIHLCALSESLQWSWSSAAAWTHSHWYSHDIQKLYMKATSFHFEIHTRTRWAPSYGETVVTALQERSPASVQSVARPSPRLAHSLLMSASTLERSPMCVIAVAKGQRGDEFML